MYSLKYKQATYADHKQLLMYNKMCQVSGPHVSGGQPPIQGKATVRLVMTTDGEVVYDQTKDKAISVILDVEPILVSAS